MHVKVGLTRYPVEVDVNETMSSFFDKVKLHANLTSGRGGMTLHHNGRELQPDEKKVKQVFENLNINQDFIAEEIRLFHSFRLD